ncbi:hypothetical protein HNQ79_004062 [Streptomyces candidus]|uniref:Uncharacterized protein n=1 Tax=Streptomyces candidus TaxID=67283 RepID=A0A7X0HHA2_9ACTN|nr:hypothetical protein [Streptomyces candidus]GHH53821.1 hypothetical protein GCM10018773_55910 [Streptomyces candidus]
MANTAFQLAQVNMFRLSLSVWREERLTRLREHGSGKRAFTLGVSFAARQARGAAADGAG